MDTWEPSARVRSPDNKDSQAAQTQTDGPKEAMTAPRLLLAAPTPKLHAHHGHTSHHTRRDWFRLGIRSRDAYPHHTTLEWLL